MKISLLDPGLKTIVGHHFDLDLRLARALFHRGHEVSVHGSTDLSPELLAKASEAGLEVHASFSIPTYRELPREKRSWNELRALPQTPPPPQTLTSAIEIYSGWARQTADELSAIPETDFWFWPTLAPYHFDAATMPTRNVRQAGGLWWDPRFPVGIGARCWSQTARRVAKTGAHFVVGAYDEMIANAHRSFSPQLNIFSLPCPHDGAVNLRQPTELKRIGFFGHQRPERGIDLMPELVNALLLRGFDVLIHDSGQTLRNKGNHPRLETLSFINDFPAQIARCDAVIWPSRWELYRQKHSGVVSECIATGVPVILPAGCLPADLAARYGCGRFFCDHSCEAILEAIDELSADFASAWARAQAAAREWRSENGANRLVQWLESQTRAGR